MPARSRIRLFAGLVGLLASGWCPAEAVAERVLTIGIPGEPETLDPPLTTGSYDQDIEMNLWEGLTARDPHGTLIPGAAERWEISADGLTYTFHLRNGLAYSNGEPVRADDFVYAVRRTADPRTATENGVWLAPIENAREIQTGTIKDLSRLGVAAPDDRTVVIRLRHPSYAMLDYSWGIVPMRRTDIEREGAGWIRPGKLVANGPFVLDRWVPQSHIDLVPNAHWRDADSVKLDRVRYVVVESTDTALKMFRNHELDVAIIAERTLPEARATVPDAVREEPMVGTYFVAFNLGAPPFKDALNLRQALALALDQTTVTEKVIRGDQRPAFGLIPPDLPKGYFAQSEFFHDWPMAKRMERARQLYAEAGYGPDNPLRLRLTYAKGRDQEKWVAAICGMWRSTLGVAAEPEGLEFRIWLGTLNHHNFTAAIDDWQSQPLGDADILNEYRSTENQNDVQFRDPGFDLLLDEADSAPDRAAHLAAFEKAERLFMDAQPIIPIYHYVKLLLISNRVSGWQPNTADLHPVRFISVAP